MIELRNLHTGKGVEIFGSAVDAARYCKRNGWLPVTSLDARRLASETLWALITVRRDLSNT